MRIERRRFLQQTGLALLTLGASQISISRFDRYVQTLAAPTGRKLALLIGINQYQDYPNLNGCLQDVELQKELLIHRFNFQSNDILTLTNTQATRENIENAFLEHLIKQATPGDVVVFHFSGYGTLVEIPKEKQSEGAKGLRGSLVPVDYNLPSKGSSTNNNLLEQTLVLLAQSVSTDKITLLLDTSYASHSQPLQGNFRVRSLPLSRSQKSSISELAFQEQLQLSLPSRQLAKKTVQPIFLRAGSDEQLAFEENWQDFSAGLFTYSFTQYLWETIPPSSLITSLKETTATMATLVGKQKKPGLNDSVITSALPYNLSSNQAIKAQGYINKIQDNDIQVKLLGLPPQVLYNYSVNACLKVAQLEPHRYLQIRHQEGINFQTRLLGENANPKQILEPGQLVQEYVRVLPRNTKLKVALDGNLTRIERVDATSALTSLDIISTVVNAGEQWADCLLGKTTTGYGLFSPGGTLIPQTTGEAEEAVKSAITRLTPYLKNILAIKLWRLTLNQGSSLLPVAANLTVLNQKTWPIWQKSTSSTTQAKDQDVLPTISLSSHVEYRITNQGKNPIYFLLLGILPNDEAIACLEPSLNDDSSAWLIKPGQERVVPNPTDKVSWTISEPVGITEVLLICSQKPWQRTLEALATNRKTLENKEQIIPISNSLAVAQAILSDLHDPKAAQLSAATADVYALGVSNWATLRFVYEVVKTSTPGER